MGEPLTPAAYEVTIGRRANADTRSTFTSVHERCVKPEVLLSSNNQGRFQSARQSWLGCLRRGTERKLKAQFTQILSELAAIVPVLTRFRVKQLGVI